MEGGGYQRRQTSPPPAAKRTSVAAFSLRGVTVEAAVSGAAGSQPTMAWTSRSTPRRRWNPPATCWT